jgi:hypothetical protein
MERLDQGHLHPKLEVPSTVLISKVFLPKQSHSRIRNKVRDPVPHKSDPDPHPWSQMSQFLMEQLRY